jgi:hypothetical protein
MKIEIWSSLYHDDSETHCYSPGGLRTTAFFRIISRKRERERKQSRPTSTARNVMQGQYATLDVCARRQMPQQYNEHQILTIIYYFVFFI